MDLYRGTVGSTGEDADIIIDAAPSWLLSYLLYVRFHLHRLRWYLYIFA
jgi:hypothetical protein